MKKSCNAFIIFFLFISLMACTNKKAKNDNVENTYKSPKLGLLWESDTIFKVPESVHYVPDKNLIFVSNINGAADNHDGNGFISTMNLNGKIIDLKWLTGLNAPKGMGSWRNYLYVTDINQLHKINMDNATIEKTYTIDSAIFLNDVAIDQEGSVFFTDTNLPAIYKLQHEGITTLKINAPLNSPNGITIFRNYLFLTSMGFETLRKIDLKNGNLVEIALNIGKGDGVSLVSDNGILASDWMGQIFYLNVKGELFQLLDFRDKKINCADIEYINEKSMLLIPTFFDNRVLAYQLSFANND